MKTSQRGIDLIKSFETCQLTAYLPTKDDVPTIGFGHTGPTIVLGMKWSQEQADYALAMDLERFEKCVSDAIKVEVTQYEFDACVSLAFNIGCKAFSISTLLRKLNANDKAGAAEQFKVWDKQAGKVLAGLTRRRKAEYDLFETTVA